MWRLVVSDRGFNWFDVFYRMTPREIEEANLALDMQYEAEKNAVRRKR